MHLAAYLSFLFTMHTFSHGTVYFRFFRSHMVERCEQNMHASPPVIGVCTLTRKADNARAVFRRGGKKRMIE